jgi:hypothetical protein
MPALKGWGLSGSMRSAGVHGRSAGSPSPHRSLLFPYWNPACSFVARSWGTNELAIRIETNRAEHAYWSIKNRSTRGYKFTGGHAAGERVVPDVERDESWQAREPDGDGAEEVVEAEVEAREQRQVAEAGGDGAVEAVGLQRQYGEPRQVSQLRGDAPGELVVAQLHHCARHGQISIQNQH